MKWISLLVSFLLSTSIIHAQAWQWGKRGGGFASGAKEEVIDMAVDNGGNVYALSHVEASGNPSVSGDPTAPVSYGSQDIMLVSYSCSGNFRWRKTIGGASSDFAVAIGADGLGHVFVLGKVSPAFTGQTKIHYDIDSIQPYANTKTIFLIQYDTSGNFKWLRQPSPDSITSASSNLLNFNVHDMLVGSDGSVEILCYLSRGLLSGTTNFVADSARAYILSYGKNGNILSLKKPQLNFTTPKDGFFYNVRMAKSKAGKYVVSGTLSDAVFSSPYKFTTGPHEVKHTMFVSLFDKNWKYLWTRENDTTFGRLLYKPIIDNVGRVYVGGLGAGNIESFNGFKFTNNLGPHIIPVLIALDSSGNNVWAKSASSIGATIGNAIALINDKVYLTGSYGFVRWDGLELSNPWNTGYDVYCVGFNSQTGAVLSLDSLKSTAGADDNPSAMITDGRGNLYIGGSMGNNLKVGPDQLQTAGGDFDFFIAKFGTANCGTVVPLTLISFKANVIKENVRLSWKTAQESNTSHFVIQRSNHANVGEGFKNMGTVSASGNSSSVRYYDFVDDHLPSGIFYYRLQMWDKDGSYTYSNIEKVDITNSAAIKVYPNPAKESVTIFGKGIIRYSIIDQIGKVILSKHTPQMQEVVLDISKLSRGIYFLETLSSEGLTRMKLIAD